MKKYMLIPVFTLLFVSALQAQKSKTFSGVITDASTQLPIPHAEIFISGTTSGCISDSSGYFILKVPFFPCTLVADHVSYESFIQAITKPEENFKIKLSPSTFSINEIEVSAKNKRRKNLKFFYSHFIRENRNQIKILNDSVLVFKRDEMEFFASSKEPLLIINYNLGYKIRLVLKEFSVYSLDRPNGNRTPLKSLRGGEVMQLTGYYYYEPIQASSLKKQESIEENRRISYYGSYRHFLKAVYDKNTKEQGYIIDPFPKDLEAMMVEIEQENPLHDVALIQIVADSLQVNYFFDDKKDPIPIDHLNDRYYLYHRKSMIYPTNEPFYLRSNGTSPKLSFVINGLMTLKSFTNSLPEDYEPLQN